MRDSLYWKADSHSGISNRSKTRHESDARESRRCSLQIMEEKCGGLLNYGNYRIRFFFWVSRRNEIGVTSLGYVISNLLFIAGSILDGGSGTSGRHASLMTSATAAINANAINTGANNNLHEASLPLRETNLAGQKINYLDSGYSEEDAEMTSCLMKTASGSVYIPGREFVNNSLFRSLIALKIIVN